MFNDLIAENIPMGVVIIQDEMILYANSWALELLGYSEDALKKIPLSGLIHPEEKKAVYKGYNEKIAGKNVPFGARYRIKNKEGDYIWVKSRSQLIEHLKKPALLSFLYDDSDGVAYEESIKKSESRYRRLVDNIAEAIAIAQDGLIKFVNNTFKDKVGLPKDQIIDKPIIDFIHPEDQNLVLERHKRRIKGETMPDRYEMRLVAPGGKVIVMEIRPTLITWEGRPATQTAFLDITKRKKAERDLKDSEQKFRVFFGAISDAVFVHEWRKEGFSNFMEVNEVACRRYGYSRPEFLKMSPKDITEVKDAAKHGTSDFRKRLSKNGSVMFETVHLDRKGNKFPVEISSNIVELNNRKIIIAVVRDISERKQAQEEIIAGEERFSTFMDFMPDMVFIKDANGKILYVNQKMKNVFGGDSWVGKRTDELFPADHARAMMEDDKKALKNGYYFLEETLTDIKGNERIFQTHKFEIKRKDNPSLLGGIAMDITEEKNRRKEREKNRLHELEQEKHALVGQVAGKMAHDFNNILSIIMGNTELSLIDCKDEELQKTLELIFDQTLRGKRLTKNLIAFAKDQEPKQEFFSVNEKIDLVIDLMKKDLHGIELIREYKANIPDLLADPGMIEHALVNLIQNSIHAMSKNYSQKIVIRTYCHSDSICFEIEDNGCGIPQEYIGQIYEPSFSLKGSKDIDGLYKQSIKGTGYGMSNVKKYVEQHKGSIKCETTRGKGTVFYVSLPVVKKELSPKEKIEIQQQAIQKSKNILVVEDEKAISDVLYKILTSDPFNHSVDIANNGQEALQFLQKRKYEFISLDYLLPGDINGMDIYHQIRAKDTAVPILFISGNFEFLESVEKMRQNDPCIDHLSKPCQNKEYVECMNALLENRVALG